MERGRERKVRWRYDELFQARSSSPDLFPSGSSTTKGSRNRAQNQARTTEEQSFSISPSSLRIETTGEGSPSAQVRAVYFYFFRCGFYLQKNLDFPWNSRLSIIFFFFHPHRDGLNRWIVSAIERNKWWKLIFLICQNYIFSSHVCFHDIINLIWLLFFSHFFESIIPSLHAGKETFYFRAKTPELRTKWITAINEAKDFYESALGSTK